MANIIYNRGLTVLNSSTVWRAMLERSTSSYSPDVDHDYVSDLSSFVEISVSSYARQTLGSFSFSPNDTTDLALLTFATIDFGTLEATGQIIKAILLYAQVGGDDTTPNDDILIARFDTLTNPALPREIGGAGTSFTLPSGLFSFAQGA